MFRQRSFGLGSGSPWASGLGLLGGSWVVISGAISPLIWVITIDTLLIPPLITTHEPPSRGSGFRGFGMVFELGALGFSEARLFLPSGARKSLSGLTFRV